MKQLSGKPKKCKICKADFIPAKTMQATCFDFGCAIEYGARKRAKEYKAETVRRKREMLDNDPKHWAKKAREACHAYIRERDKDRPCVSCGRHHDGQYHAGHYRPSGVNSALRYDERNIYKQCSPCNNHKSGDLVNYRKSLIGRIGLDMVEWLDNNHEVKRWTVAELKEVHRHYTEKLKELRQ